MNDTGVDTVTVGAFAIVPCSDLAAAPTMLTNTSYCADGGCELHLVQAGPPPWNVPEHNAFGIFLRMPDVAEFAALADDFVIRPGGVLRHREWGMYEVALNGPDQMLVRIGWPSHLCAAAD